MGSVFFTFYYDDGSNRPFDPPEITPDTALDSGQSQYEVPEVTADGLIDIFKLKQKELKQLGIAGSDLLPSFITDFDPKAKDNGIGMEENVYGEAMTIPVEPLQLKVWAEKWRHILQNMGTEERKRVLIDNWKYAEDTINYLDQIAKQAECAMEHQVGIMLYVAW